MSLAGFAVILFWAIFASLGCLDLRMQRNCYRELFRKAELDANTARVELARLNLAVNRKGGAFDV